MDESNTNNLNFKMLLLGAGMQGKNTIFKHVKLKHVDTQYEFGNNTRHVLHQNLLTNLAACAQLPPVKAYFSTVELTKIAKNRSVELSQHTIEEVRKGITRSVEVYTAAFEKSLKQENIEQYQEKWPPLLLTKHKLAPKDTRHDYDAMIDPTSEACMQVMLAHAAAAQQVLMRKLVGESAAATWKPRNKATGDDGLFVVQQQQQQLDWVDEAFNPGLKDPQRIRFKAQYKYNNNFTCVKDIARVALQFQTYGKMQVLGGATCQCWCACSWTSMCLVVCGTFVRYNCITHC
eukprot:c10380_g1_i1.p1 GENE.c10380_g1_i1~~c10380_g1_i1.p1  ORF type:complete len:290 (+),score=94.07 c10380_g1_i1:89-958(+)